MITMSQNDNSPKSNVARSCLPNHQLSQVGTIYAVNVRCSLIYKITNPLIGSGIAQRAQEIATASA
jgi:hypothetical protein